VFIILDIIIVDDTLVHFTQWTWIAQTTVAWFYCVDYVLKKDETGSWLAVVSNANIKPSVFHVLVDAFLLPFVYPISWTVAIVVSVIVEVSPIASDALSTYSAGVTWTYNFYIHYLPVIVHTMYLCVEFKSILNVTFYGSTNLVKLSSILGVFFASERFLFIYMVHNDVTKVYELQSLNLTFVEYYAIMVLSFVFFSFVYYSIIYRAKFKNR